MNSNLSEQIKQELNKKQHIIRNLGVDESKMTSLSDFLVFLMEKNEELNLVSRQMTIPELVDNHLIDCLLPLYLFPKNLKTVADFGTGGGLPGVLFALLFPEIQFHLYEKSPKKRQYLEDCRRFAKNLNLHSEINPNFGGVDLVIARAFKPLDVLLDLSRKYYSSGGKYFLLKGRRDKIEEEFVLAQKKFKHLKISVDLLKSPVVEVERHLVRINL